MGIANAVKTSFRNLLSGERDSSAEINKPGRRRVLVSSNCQTGGIAAALQVIFPADEITPAALPALDNAEAVSAFVQKLANADVWVSIGGHDLLQKHGLAERIRLVRIPIIRFPGFHPDLVYARRTSTKELIDPHYNSAIAIWAYKNGLSIDEAERLFNHKVFAGLGYLNHWEPSLEQLKQRFKDSDLEFADFMLPMRREGVFMYSLNHPKVLALARLAKLVAVKLGEDKSVLDRDIDINDGLNEVIWPIYPEIGDSLALHSSYEWKMGEGKWIRGLRPFLANAYENYASQNISPDDISAVQIDEQRYDRVLRGELGRRA